MNFTGSIRAVASVIAFFLLALLLIACGDSLETKEQVRTEAYPFATAKNDDCNLAKGQTQTKQRGQGFDD